MENNWISEDNPSVPGERVYVKKITNMSNQQQLKVFHLTLEGPDSDFGPTRHETVRVVIEQSWPWDDDQINDMRQTLKDHYDVSSIQTDEEVKAEEEYWENENKKLSNGENNLELHKQITFEEFVKHGINNGANIINSVPWSWKINGKGVTHENDNSYIVETFDGIQRFDRGEYLIAHENGLHILRDHNTHCPGSCPL